LIEGDFPFQTEDRILCQVPVWWMSCPSRLDRDPVFQLLLHALAADIFDIEEKLRDDAIRLTKKTAQAKVDAQKALQEKKEKRLILDEAEAKVITLLQAKRATARKLHDFVTKRGKENLTAKDAPRPSSLVATSKEATDSTHTAATNSRESRHSTGSRPSSIAMSGPPPLAIAGGSSTLRPPLGPSMASARLAPSLGFIGHSKSIANTAADNPVESGLTAPQRQRPTLAQMGRIVRQPHTQKPSSSRRPSAGSEFAASESAEDGITQGGSQRPSSNAYPPSSTVHTEVAPSARPPVSSIGGSAEASSIPTLSRGDRRVFMRLSALLAAIDSRIKEAAQVWKQAAWDYTLSETNADELTAVSAAIMSQIVACSAHAEEQKTALLRVTLQTISKAWTQWDAHFLQTSLRSTSASGSFSAEDEVDASNLFSGTLTLYDA
jgi:hypothetical protein